MYKATDIANFLVYLMSDSCDDLTNLKLNKILYYAQGHYLKNFGEPLFDDKIEAWQYGPVVNSVYHTYKCFNNQPITGCNAEKVNLIEDKVKSFLVDIARKYGRFTASTLLNMTHKPKSPWAEVQEGEEITVKRIQDYFINNEEPIVPLELNYTEEDFIGHRDSNGVLVLPGGWNDAEI